MGTLASKARPAGIALVVLTTTVLAFQNCAPGFELNEAAKIAALGSDTGSGDTGTPSTPPPVPTAPPVMAPELRDNPAATTLAAGFFQPFSDTRIFQRDSTGEAAIPLSRVGTEPALARFRVSFVMNEAGAVLSQKTLESNLTVSFPPTLQVRTDSGMNYRRVRVSYYDQSGQELARWQSARFAVGEVFLAAGQSNAATHGETMQISRVAMNRMVNPTNQAWLPLRDPMPIASNWSMPDFGSRADPGGSPWPIFADALSQNLGVPVAVVSVGYGGTSSLEWQKGNARALYPRLTSAASALSGCSFRAVLWHQGESDAIGKVSTATYISQMKSLQQSFRTDTGCRAQPWIVAQAAWVPFEGFPDVTTNDITAIANAQKMLWQEVGFAQGPNTDQWTLFPTHRVDRLHFSTLGLGLHGQAWRDRVRAVFAL